MATPGTVKVKIVPPTEPVAGVEAVNLGVRVRLASITEADSGVPSAK